MHRSLQSCPLVCPPLTFDLCPHHPHRKRLRRQRGCISSPHSDHVSHFLSHHFHWKPAEHHTHTCTTHTHTRLCLRNLEQTLKFCTSSYTYCPTAARLNFYTTSAKSRLNTDCFLPSESVPFRLCVCFCVLVVCLCVEIYLSYCRECCV